MARTAQQIQDAMHVGLEAGAGLVSSWHLDGDGSDSVGENHGSIFGNAVFVPSDSPVTFSMDPGHADWRGGAVVTLTGSFGQFTSVPDVIFGTKPATGVTVVNDTVITVTTPPVDQPGLVSSVTVTNGSAELSSIEGFVFTPRLTGPARVGLTDLLEVQVAFDSPSQVTVIAGRPALRPHQSFGTDWFREIDAARRVFHATAPEQIELSFTMPASGLVGTVGIPVRLQALVLTGDLLPTFTNSVDVVIE